MRNSNLDQNDESPHGYFCRIPRPAIETHAKVGWRLSGEYCIELNEIALLYEFRLCMQNNLACTGIYSLHLVQVNELERPFQYFTTSYISMLSEAARQSARTNE